jgi:hypothetical protein
MRSPHESPFSPLAAARTWERVAGIWVVTLLLPRLGASGLGAMLLVFAVVGWLWTRHRFGRGPLAALLRVREQQPWFFPDAVVRDVRTAEPEFAAACSRAGVQVHPIDGRRIASWSDLAGELAAVFGPRRFPAEPRENCFAILRAAAERPGVKLIAWQHADVTTQRNPALLFDFLTRFAVGPHSSWRPLLVACDLAAETEPKVAVLPLRRGVSRTTMTIAGADEPAPVSAGAPADAWWKARPGELTR